MGPVRGGSQMRMFNFHLAMAFMKQKAKKKKRPGEARDMLKAKEPEPGLPSSHARVLFTHPAPFSGRGQSWKVLLLR